nr:immunoglobulin light chain junction region [Macaca mulatta]
CQQNSNWPWTF